MKAKHTGGPEHSQRVGGPGPGGHARGGWFDRGGKGGGSSEDCGRLGGFAVADQTACVFDEDLLSMTEKPPTETRISSFYHNNECTISINGGFGPFSVSRE